MLPFPPPGALPDPGIEPEFPALAGEFFTTEAPGQQPLFRLTPDSFCLTFLFFKIFIKKNIYLAAPHLGCGMWDLRTSLQHAGSLVVTCRI